jgi:hypothetical protein
MLNLKKGLLVLLFALPSLLNAQEVIVLEGNYQLRNIFVNNPIGKDGVGFCVTNVFVNGEVSTDEINQNAFEIDLSLFNLGFGDPVTVEIQHKANCKPEVINPLALQPQATFKTESISIDDNALIKWSTTNETGVLPYRVQQFKWNKWVTVGEVQGKGNPGEHAYSFQAIPVSGNNRFRVIQKSGDGRVKVSPEVTFTSSSPAVSYSFDKKTKTVVFDRSTSYEVYNEYGQIVKRGYDANVQMEDLSKGLYYINYDNTYTEVQR